MIYTFPIYIPAAAAAVAVVAAVFALLCLISRPWRVAAIPCGLVALFAGGLIAPILLMDRVVLNEKKLEQTTGFWFSPTVKGFPLADVESVTIRTATDRRNRRYEQWYVSYKDGSSEAIDPGDLWVLNGQDIANRLRQKGIVVVQE